MLDLIWTKLCLSPATYCAVVKSGNGALQGAVQDVVQKVRWGKQRTVLCKVLSKAWRQNLAKVLCRVLCRVLCGVLCRMLCWVLCWVLSTSAVVKFDQVRVRSAAQVAGHSAVQSAAEKSGKGIV